MRTQDTTYGVPEYWGMGRPKKPGYQSPPVRAEVLARSFLPGQYRPVSWRHGRKGSMTSRFASVRVRPANRNPAQPGRKPAGGVVASRMAPQCRGPKGLLAIDPAGGHRHRDGGVVVQDPVAHRAQHDYRELKHGLGLDHFEGHSWWGWHYHTVLVTAAHLFVTQQRVAADSKPGGGLSFYAVLAELQTAVIALSGQCPYCDLAPNCQSTTNLFKKIALSDKCNKFR